MINMEKRFDQMKAKSVATAALDRYTEGDENGTRHALYDLFQLCVSPDFNKYTSSLLNAATQRPSKDRMTSTDIMQEVVAGVRVSLAELAKYASKEYFTHKNILPHFNIIRSSFQCLRDYEEEIDASFSRQQSH